jgi:hypothetical protein
MCMSCECGRPDDQMGEERHLTLEKVQAAADAAGISLQEVAENISKSAAAEKA